jgi:nitrogen fixation protein FixH
MKQKSLHKSAHWEMKSHHALAAFLALFGLFIIANGIMAFSAISTWSGLDQPKAYIHGLKYNEVLASAAEQNAKGWSGELTIKQADDRTLTLSFMPQNDLKEVEDIQHITAFFRRPAFAWMDQTLPLVKNKDGSFYLEKPLLLAPGQWDIDLKAYNGQNETPLFRSIQRVILK